MIKWISIKDRLPDLFDISEYTSISATYLVWIKGDSFTVACVSLDKLDGKISWLAGSEGFDITEMVTHWAAAVEGP